MLLVWNRNFRRNSWVGNVEVEFLAPDRFHEIINYHIVQRFGGIGYWTGSEGRTTRQPGMSEHEGQKRLNRKNRVDAEV